MSIFGDETALTEEMERELDRRYQLIVKNPQEGKSWEEVKTGLLNRKMIIRMPFSY